MKQDAKPKARSRTASSKPEFLVADGGKLYLTRSVAEFDPGDSKLQKRQTQSLRELQGIVQEQGAVRYRKGPGSSAVDQLLSGKMETKAAMVGEGFAATDPPVEQ